MTAPIPTPPPIQPQQQQPRGRKVDLSRVVEEQAMTIGSLHTNLTMANLDIATLEQENADLRERLAGYENDVAVTADAEGSPESRDISGV